MFDLLQEASRSLIEELERLGKIKSVEAGDELIKEGTIDGSIYVLKDGALSVTTSNAAGEQQSLAELVPGCVVGEMSWLENRPAVASVAATKSGSVLALPYETLNQLEASNAELGAEWQLVLARKLALQITSQNAWIHRFSEANKEIEPLRKVLVLFAGLEDQDVNTLSNLGSLKRIPPNGVLIQQGETVNSLYLILAGDAEINVEINGINRQVGSSRRGELLGELTLLLQDDKGATASVYTATGMEVLEINKMQLLQHFGLHPQMARRFYRSLSCMISQRSRDQLLSRQLATESQRAEKNDQDDELDLLQLGGINRAGQRFSSLCQKFQSSQDIP